MTELHELTSLFGFKWHFVTARISAKFVQSRASRPVAYKRKGTKNSTIIRCDCDWAVKFTFCNNRNQKSTDTVSITHFFGDHTNGNDLDSVDQFVLCQSRGGHYKRCTDSILQEIMMQPALNPFVDGRTMYGSVKNYYRKRTSQRG